MVLAINIAKFRIKKGLTQKELAEAAGLSQGYIAAIEEGRVKPKIKTLAIIAQSLEVSLEEILQ